MDQSRIEIDFAAAYSQAKKLDDVADEMKRLANQQLNSTIGKIGSSWKGESATAYLNKAEIVRDNITQTAQSLASIAASIRSDAQRIYNAEKAALEIAKTRNT